LRILIITHGPWSNNLGAVKVHYDLKITYESLGHFVDVISLDDFNLKNNKIRNLILNYRFPFLVFNKIKCIVHKYDLIDTNHGCITKNLREVGFSGLLLLRSHGDMNIYDWYLSHPVLKFQISRVEKLSFKTFVGNSLRKLLNNKQVSDRLKSINISDVLHCLNNTELLYYRSIFGDTKRLVYHPNGLLDSFIDNAISFKTNRFNNSGISFIGSWTFRKGILDLNKIFTTIMNTNSNSLHFKLLGGDVSTKKMQSLFEEKLFSKLTYIPNYNASDLFSILGDIKVGVFTSYVEGMPLSVLEQISFGIPVVAYDVPGVREILTKIDNRLLIEIGDDLKFANRVSEILNFHNSEYFKISNKCKQVAQEYKLNSLTFQFLNNLQLI
jgi:glycosyltransferase involved in cell wall biosynthesis